MKWNIPQYTIIKNITKNQTSFTIKNYFYFIETVSRESK